MNKKKSSALLVANWKMNKSSSSAKLFFKELAEYKNNFILCPPYTLLDGLKGITLGGQDCSAFSESEGSFTGDISAVMLKDMGCKYVIVGHSERRKHHHESNELIKQKISNAHKAGLIAILCIGESAQDREEGSYYNILKQQLIEALPVSANEDNTIIAYEPVWAIGSGKAADINQIGEVHQFLASLSSIKLLYGGSVTSNNAQEILAINNVNGLLIGGASLSASTFIEIIKLAYN